MQQVTIYSILASTRIIACMSSYRHSKQALTYRSGDIRVYNVLRSSYGDPALALWIYRLIDKAHFRLRIMQVSQNHRAAFWVGMNASLKSKTWIRLSDFDGTRTPWVTRNNVGPNSAASWVRAIHVWSVAFLSSRHMVYQIPESLLSNLTLLFMLVNAPWPFHNRGRATLTMGLAI